MGFDDADTRFGGSLVTDNLRPAWEAQYRFGPIPGLGAFGRPEALVVQDPRTIRAVSPILRPGGYYRGDAPAIGRGEYVVAPRRDQEIFVPDVRNERWQPMRGGMGATPHDTMRVPDVRAERRVDLSGGRLGQGAGDIDRVMEIGEFISASGKFTEDEAAALYVATMRIMSIRAKVMQITETMAWVSSLGVPLSRDLLESIVNIGKIATKLGQPNLSQTLINQRQALELSILPRFGIYATGIFPVLRQAGVKGFTRTEIVGATFDTRIPRKAYRRAIDLGDLTKSSIEADFNIMASVMPALMAATAGIGWILPVVISAIVFGFLIVSTGVGGGLYKWLSSLGGGVDTSQMTTEQREAYFRRKAEQENWLGIVGEGLKIAAIAIGGSIALGLFIWLVK